MLANLAEFMEPYARLLESWVPDCRVNARKVYGACGIVANTRASNTCLLLHTYDWVADVLACNGSFEKNAAWCREKKVLLNTYSYVCAGVTAAHTPLNYGFSAYRYGTAAVNGWALRWYNGHPYNDLDAGCTDWGIFLPNWAGAPISTPSWEGFREGVDDLRYLAVLEGLVKEGKSDGKLLEDLRANGVGKTTEMRETVVGDSFFGAAMRNAQGLDLTRARLIQEILRAQRK
jgi:hypothetical protein